MTLRIFCGLQFTWRAIRLVVLSAMKTSGKDTAAAESSRMLRVVASVPYRKLLIRNVMQRWKL